MQHILNFRWHRWNTLNRRAINAVLWLEYVIAENITNNEWLSGAFDVGKRRYMMTANWRDVEESILKSSPNNIEMEKNKPCSNLQNGVQHYTSKALSQYSIRRFIVRSHEVSKPRGW